MMDKNETVVKQISQLELELLYLQSYLARKDISIKDRRAATADLRRLEQMMGTRRAVRSA